MSAQPDDRRTHRLQARAQRRLRLERAGQRSIDFDAAAARRDDGIQRAIQHAGERWRRLANGYVKEYLATLRVGDDFLGEHVRSFAAGRGLESPPDGRAWGQVMRDGAREGLIEKVGYAPAKSSNLSPKVLWRRIR